MTEIPRMTKEQRDALFKIEYGTMRTIAYDNRVELQSYVKGKHLDDQWKIVHEFPISKEPRAEL